MDFFHNAFEPDMLPLWFLFAWVIILAALSVVLGKKNEDKRQTIEALKDRLAEEIEHSGNIIEGLRRSTRDHSDDADKYAARLDEIRAIVNRDMP